MLVSLFFLTSCGGPLSEKDYVEWVRSTENGLKTVKEVDDLKLTVQYKPHDFVALQESKGKTGDAAGFNELKKELRGLDYYEIKIQAEAGQKLEELLQVNGVENPTYYLAYGLQKEIYMEGPDGAKQFPVLYHFERSHDMAPHKTLMIAFEVKEGSKEDKILVVHASGFQTGPVKMAITKEQLNSIPKLKIG